MQHLPGNFHGGCQQLLGHFLIECADRRLDTIQQGIQASGNLLGLGQTFRIASGIALFVRVGVHLFDFGRRRQDNHRRSFRLDTFNHGFRHHLRLDRRRGSLSSRLFCRPLGRLLGLIKSRHLPALVSGEFVSGNEVGHGKWRVKGEK